LIDEIESITVQRKDTETIYVLVFIPQSDGTIAETLLETRFTEDFTQREDLSIAIADLFDKSAEFGDEFDLITLEEITLVGDIDLARYILVDENGDPIEEDEVEEEPTEEPEPTTPVDTEQSSSTPIVVEEEEPTQEEPEESTGIDESIIEQLIAVILQIIAESGLDIDISELTN